MEQRTLFAPDKPTDRAQSRHIALDEMRLEVDEVLPLAGYPEERLYVFTDGRGFMDIYPGDHYEIRQTTALWTTPLIPTEIRNTGPRPLHFVVFRIGDVPLPEQHDGMLTWTAVGADGKAAPGSGQNTVYVYETHRHEEGLHLRIHLIPLRRAQRMHDPAEMLTLLPGGSTQRHTHPDIEESIYILCGSGQALWNDTWLDISPGDALCYPPHVVRKVTNTGATPLTYLCVSCGVTSG